MPRVSVIIPTHNRLATLEAALESVRQQVFRDYEVIVVDDGSADGTAEWMESQFLRPAGVPSASFVRIGPRPVGAAAARNRGLDRARGEIVAFLDDDDRWHPGYLQVQAGQFDAHPEAEVCTTGHVESWRAGEISRPELRRAYPYSDFLIHLLAECPIHTLSVVACRRSAFDRVGMFDETLSVVHDLDWYWRLSVRGARFVHCSQELVDHAVPGGLVTQYRKWFEEECGVHRRCFEEGCVSARDRRTIRAARGLFFGRTGLAKGDLAFGLSRLLEAFGSAPTAATQMIARRAQQRLQRALAPMFETQAGRPQTGDER